MRVCTRITISSPLLYTSLLTLLLTNLTSAHNPPTYAPFARTPGLPSLFPRQSLCSDATSTTSCGVGNFCCPTDTRCIPVERNSSVVCCKIGEFCDEIFPIACGSATLSSDSIKCGTQCCPLGYDCGDTKDRCIMKAENLPADHVANRDSKKSQSDEAMREECLTFLSMDGEDEKKCSKFSFEGILVGLFPGIAIGVAIMFAYIKTVEMKTRRRTIRFNGRLSASPDDLSFIDQKPPAVPAIQEDIAIGYSPTAERAMSPATFQRDWKARSPADYSPNLGPVIAPRERSVSRDRALGERLGTASRVGTTPSPHPLAGSPLKPRPVHGLSRMSADSETTNGSETESESSTAVSQTIGSPGVGQKIYHRHLDPGRDSYMTDDDDDDGFSEVVIMDGTGDSLHHHSLSHREQERGRGRSRISTETGYTASVYQATERLSELPYSVEPQVPPLNYRGSLQDGPGYDRF